MSHTVKYVRYAIKFEEDIVETPSPHTAEEIREHNEIAEYIFGLVAKRDGKEFDDTKSIAWKRGWAEAQE
jgi:hypothetical protein